MGGSLNVISREGKGSHFSFKVPIPIKELPSERCPLSLKDLTLLVFYPSSATQEMLRSLFSAWSINVTIVSQEEDALFALQRAQDVKNPIKILLFDYDALDDEPSRLLHFILSEETFAHLKLSRSR